VSWDTELKCLEVGRAEVLEEGEDVLLLAIGSMVHPALEAAQRLRGREGIKTSVVNARFLKPLDLTLIGEMVQRTARMLILEENVLPGGFGSAVLEGLVDRRLSLEGLQIERMGIPDTVICQGTMQGVRARYGLCSESIAAKVLQMVQNPVSLRSRTGKVSRLRNRG